MADEMNVSKDDKVAVDFEELLDESGSSSKLTKFAPRGYLINVLVSLRTLIVLEP
jgi:hypothetical protein